MGKIQTFRINGMTCQHCVTAVRDRLLAIPGVDAADVRIAPAQAVVTGSADVRAIVQAVADAGYLAVAEGPGVSVV
jgi:copper chaperone